MTVQDETGNAAAASTSPSPLAQLMELATKLQGQSSTSTSVTTSPTMDVPMAAPVTAPTTVVTATTDTTTPPIKKGVATSEFLLKLAVDVSATVLLLTHNITSTEWAAMTGGTTAVYVAARTWLKG